MVMGDERSKLRTVRSFCRICTTICGIEVDVDGDRVVRVRGGRGARPAASP
jgi:anaerobic selenocysteine-containing dehydrogenase